MEVREWLSGMGKEDSSMGEELRSVVIYDFGTKSLWKVCLGRVRFVWREEGLGDGQLDGEVDGSGSHTSATIPGSHDMVARQLTVYCMQTDSASFWPYHPA